MKDYDKVWLEDEIKKFNKKIDLLKDSINDIKHNKKLKKSLESDLGDTEEELSQLNYEYKKEKKVKLEIKSDKFLEKTQQVELKIKKLNRSIKKLEIEDNLLEWLIKDPLSNSGIKAYIFNSLLSKVNYRLEEYSELLGFNIEFGIDMDSNSKDFYQMIYKNDLIIPYSDLSGGQKQLVDTSVALAIHDVISSIRPTNILFLDEPFEGLDNESVELISEIITHKAKKQCLFLITHLPFNPTNSSTIHFSIDDKGRTAIN